MSMGFGRVAPGDWDKVRSGSQADTVDSGDYIGKLIQVRHIDPEKSKNKLGSYIIVFELTEDNEDEQWHGKKVEWRGSYCPDLEAAPETKQDGWGKMNDITLQNLAQLVVACNAEPITTPDGMYDTVGTVQLLPDMQPECAFSVVHGTYNDRPTQDLEKFRPVA